MNKYTIILNAHGIGANQSIVPKWFKNSQPIATQPTVDEFSVDDTFLINCFTQPYPYSLNTYKDLGVAVQAYTNNNPTANLKAQLSAHETANGTGYLIGITTGANPENEDVFTNAVFYNSEVFNTLNQHGQRATSLTMTFNPGVAAKSTLSNPQADLAMVFSFGDPHVESTILKVKKGC